LPQGKVVAEKLHDESGVLVVGLSKLVELGNGLVEGVAGQVAGLLSVLKNFIKAHRVVKRQTQADRVSGLQAVRLVLGELEGTLVVFSSCGTKKLNVSIASIQNNKRLHTVVLVVGVLNALGKISVIVASHLQVKHLGLVAIIGGCAVFDELVLQEAQKLFTDTGNLPLDLRAVLVEKRILLQLVIAIHASPRCTTGSNNVFVGNRKQIAERTRGLL